MAEIDLMSWWAFLLRRDLRQGLQGASASDLADGGRQQPVSDAWTRPPRSA